MGTLADSLFNVLMSWVRALVNSIWALFTTDHMTLLEFLGKNWVMLVVIMLAAGLVMDWLVWLVRWKPYHLWARRVRRFLHLPSPEKEEEEERKQRKKAKRQPSAPVEEEQWDESDEEQWLPLEQPRLDARQEQEVMRQAESVPDAELGAYPGMKYGAQAVSRESMESTQRYAAVHSEGPGAAALCGMLSALTRMPGVIVSGLFIIAFLAKIPREGVKAKALFACVGQVLLVFCGLFIYWAINWVVTGVPMMYLTYQRENWYQEAGSFWQSAEQTMYYILSTFGEDDWLFTWVFQGLAMAYLYVLLAFEQKKLPFDLAAYSFVYVAVVLSPTWLLSGARYLYALCALPLMQASVFRKKDAHVITLCISGALLVLFIFGYTIAVMVF